MLLGLQRGPLSFPVDRSSVKAKCKHYTEVWSAKLTLVSCDVETDCKFPSLSKYESSASGISVPTDTLATTWLDILADLDAVVCTWASCQRLGRKLELILRRDAERLVN